MWKVQNVTRSPQQSRIAISNDDASATPTFDYRAADALARRTLGPVSLDARGYSLTGNALRVYVSQAY